MKWFAELFVVLAFIATYACAWDDGLWQEKAEKQLPKEITLYHLYGDDIIKIIGPMPSEYIDRYQIPMDVLPDYVEFEKYSGSSINITDDGLIRPKCEIVYHKGNTWGTAYIEDYDYIDVDCYDGVSILRVRCDEWVHDIKVTVYDYISVYVNKTAAAIVSEVTTAEMTGEEKLRAFAKWVGQNTDYCYNYSGASGMFLYGCGDCWASTSSIIKMCQQAGMECRSRRANFVPGAGSGHMNVLAYTDGKYFIAEAGYSSKKPRPGSVWEEPFGCYLNDSVLVQYDGSEKEVRLPSAIGDTTITQLGNNRTYVFDGYNIETLYIPASFEAIGEYAFGYLDDLKNVLVDSNSKYFEASDGLLYTKGRGTLIHTPVARTSVSIDKSTKNVGFEALANLNLDSLEIPGNVEYIDGLALYESVIGELKIGNGVRYIDSSAFRRAEIPKVVLPDSVTKLGVLVFYYSWVDEVILSKNIKELPWGTFMDTYVSEVLIPEGVEIIGDECFSEAHRMENVTLPKSITYIGKNAFTSYTKNIFYVGSESDWNKIRFNNTLPSTITVHFNSVQGECTNGACCDPETRMYRPKGYACRPAVGECDVEEVCSGSNALCPPDVLVPKGVLCRAKRPGYGCDKPEFCDGWRGKCPMDDVYRAGVVCNKSRGPCEEDSVCTGNMYNCLRKQIRTSTWVCRKAVGSCDKPEYCDGVNVTCPEDVFLPEGTPCYGDDHCTGTSGWCPSEPIPVSSSSESQSESLYFSDGSGGLSIMMIAIIASVAGAAVIAAVIITTVVLVKKKKNNPDTHSVALESVSTKPDQPAQVETVPASHYAPSTPPPAPPAAHPRPAPAPYHPAPAARPRPAPAAPPRAAPATPPRNNPPPPPRGRPAPAPRGRGGARPSYL